MPSTNLIAGRRASRQELTALPRRRRNRKAMRKCNYPYIPSFRFHLDTAGRQHFNFPQVIWLKQKTAMTFGSVQNVGLRTLAINLIILASQGDPRTLKGLNRKAALSIVSVFCEECLLTAPQHAWILPREAINAWLNSRVHDVH